MLSLPNVNIEKLNRLKSRLVTKNFSNGINPQPSFTGAQEFYKDFIDVASEHVFLKHLSDAFASEIVELNDTTFVSLDDLGDGSRSGLLQFFF